MIPVPIRWSPMESAALDAMPSGCLFADWIEQKKISKSTAYKWRSDLGIKPDKRRVGTRVEVWLSAADEALLGQYAELMARDMTVPEALAALGRSVPVEPIGATAIVPVEPTGISAIVPAESDGAQGTAPVESDGVRQLEQLRTRLAALRDAAELGAPLTTAEVSVLLGARAGGVEVVRGRLRAVKQSHNCWTIEPD
jgi:hypothetical protein